MLIFYSSHYDLIMTLKRSHSLRDYRKLKKETQCHSELNRLYSDERLMETPQLDNL